MNFSRSALIGLVFIISGCATQLTSVTPVAPEKPDLSNSEERQWKLMVGKWYGNQPSIDGGRVEWIAERKLDGTYQIRFRTTRSNGSISENVEVGEWGVSGPVYFSTFKGWIRNGRFVPNSPNDPYNRDTYKIISLAEEAFTYEHFATGNEFTVKRVPDTFDFESK